ncbi:MAG: hypothetical protein WBM00_10280 [Solirubrobacterales bacterium]
MIRRRESATLLATLAVTAALVFGAAGSASAGVLQPGQGKTFFGLTDSGVNSQFTEFTEMVGKHPAVIETFRSWGTDLLASVKRWQNALARPVLHISTADASGEQIITPRGIALGKGDDYLIALNQLFWSRGMRAYIRPLGEPNRCLNLYAAYDCNGVPKASYQSPYWYKQAFRRIYIIVHGGGTLEAIDSRLASANLPPLATQSGELPTGLPKAPVAVIWSPLPTGSPGIHKNLPEHFYPGAPYVDWVGTDFYSTYPEWKALTALYSRFKHKPFTLTEWGLDGSDDVRFVKQLFAWLRLHPRCRMLIYYQDFGSSNAYRLQNYPASLAIVKRKLSSPVFPPYAFEPPQPPPPPPGGVSP